MIFLAYRACGPLGEPKVVHIDQENDCRITPLSDSFEAFIRGLVSEDDFYREQISLSPPGTGKGGEPLWR